VPGLNARCASRIGIVAQGDYEQIGGATKIGRADQIALLPNLPGAVTHGNQVQGRETLLAQDLQCEGLTCADGKIIRPPKQVIKSNPGRSFF